MGGKMVAKTRLMDILDKFKDMKIAVIGDMMLDDYIIGEVTRISPEAPVPVVNVKEERFVLGGGANVLNNLSSLSCKCYSFGVIGDDSNGNRLLNELKKENIDTVGVVIAEDRPTIVKRRIIAQHQQLLRLDWEDKKNITPYHEELIIENLKSHIDKLDAIILSDYDKGVLTPTLARKIIKMARKNNIIVTVDPKPSNAINYLGATSMTPNRKEAMECMGLSRIEDTEKLGLELKSKLNLDNLLLTRSEEGMSIFLENEIINIPTFAKEVYDVTGAGDTVISVFTLAAAAGASWHEAAKIANVAAGVVVGRMGTSTVTKEEITEFYDKIYREWK
jgi:rfaE bifunctional protein kinase chain/domain